MKRVLLTALLASGLLAATGCADTQEPDSGRHTAVVDVRTPEEFAASHVVGAVNIDVQSPGFGRQVAALDPNGTYLVYCRSGNRSAAAAQQMRAVGLSVTDGRGLADMQSAGYAFTS